MFRSTGRHQGKCIDFVIWVCGAVLRMASLHCDDNAESLCDKAYCEWHPLHLCEEAEMH